jgi:hypothetical protein
MFVLHMPNEKLPDDEDLANDARFETKACLRSLPFGRASC